MRRVTRAAILKSAKDYRKPPPSRATARLVTIPDSTDNSIKAIGIRRNLKNQLGTVNRSGVIRALVEDEMIRLWGVKEL